MASRFTDVARSAAQFASQHGPSGSSLITYADDASQMYTKCDWTFYAMIGLVLSLVYLLAVWDNPQTLKEWLKFTAYVVLIGSAGTMFLMYNYGRD